MRFNTDIDSRVWARTLRLTSVWVGNSYEMLRCRMPVFTRDYIRTQCEAVAANGFNAIGLVCGHFRWSFVEDFPHILDHISTIVDVGKEFGLKVCEHHSVNLMYPKVIQYKNWNLGDYVQLDAWGKPFYGPGGYGCTYLCTTNPEFVEAYKDHVRDIVDTGIELFMPDDMSAAIDWYTCCCPHCRKLFNELTGHVLPRSGDVDDSFFGNMDNPAFRAWVRFRAVKVGLFLREMRRFVDSQRKGILMLSCNSDATSTAGRYYCQNCEPWFELGNLDLGMHEIWGEEVLESNYPRMLTELQVTKAIGDHYGAPTIAWGYSASTEQTVCCRIQHLSLGLRSHGCYKDVLPNSYRHMNGFEAANQQVFSDAHTFANVGVMFSMNTRDFYGPTTYTRSNLDMYSDEFAGWCEALISGMVPHKVVIDADVEEGKLSDLAVLVLPNVACLSKRMVENIEKFVSEGGTLIASHETSLFDETGARQTDFQLNEVFGFNHVSTERGVNYPILINYATEEDYWYNLRSSYPMTSYDSETRDAIFAGISRRKLKHHAAQTIVMIKGSGVQMLAHSPIVRGGTYGFPSIISRDYGKGRVLYFAGLPGLMNTSPTYFTVSQYGEDPCELHDERMPEYAGIITNCVRWALAGNERVWFEGGEGSVVSTLFRTADGSKVYLHLAAVPKMNISPDGRRLIPTSSLHDIPEDKWFDWAGWDETITEPDGVPFQYEEVGPMTVHLSSSLGVGSARMISPDFLGERNLAVGQQDDHKVIELNKGDVRRYSVLILEAE